MNVFIENSCFKKQKQTKKRITNRDQSKLINFFFCIDYLDIINVIDSYSENHWVERAIKYIRENNESRH